MAHNFCAGPFIPLDPPRRVPVSLTGSKDTSQTQITGLTPSIRGDFAESGMVLSILRVQKPPQAAKDAATSLGSSYIFS